MKNLTQYIYETFNDLSLLLQDFFNGDDNLEPEDVYKGKDIIDDINLLIDDKEVNVNLKDMQELFNRLASYKDMSFDKFEVNDKNSFLYELGDELINYKQFKEVFFTNDDDFTVEVYEDKASVLVSVYYGKEIQYDWSLYVAFK